MGDLEQCEDNLDEIKEYEGRTIRYTSNMSIQEGAQFYIGRVYGVDGEEVSINGMWHNVKSIVVLEEIHYNNGVNDGL
jgi:hypothetical protein